MSSLGRVQKTKDVPSEVRSCEAPSRHPYSKPPRRVITSNLVPQNVNGKAVIICLAEAGQAWMSAGPVRVSLHLSHTLLEADSQLAITTAGPIISALQEHAPLVTPPSSPTCPSAVDH